MRTTIHTGENSGIAILSRVIEPMNEPLTPDAARTLLTLRFQKIDERRMNQLAAMARKGTLSERERDEAEQYNLVGHMLALLHAKARRALEQHGFDPSDT